MKITKIETVRLTSRPTLIWVRVHTDEGLIGLGESWFGCAAVDADIHERIAAALIGADPSRIEARTRAARPYVGFCGTGVEIRAVSAIDVALWDIVGQAAGKPLYALLGGATQDDIRVYNTCAGPDYVSQSSDVRPENFGLSGSTPIHGRRYEDLKAFMTRPDELAAELLEMNIPGDHARLLLRLVPRVPGPAAPDRTGPHPCPGRQRAWRCAASRPPFAP